MKDRGLF